MIPTLAQVYTDTRILLEDTGNSGAGQRFTDNYLNPFAQAAWSELYSTAMGHNLALVRQTRFHILPAYTGDLFPAVAKIGNFGEPVKLYERGFLASNSVAVTGLTTPDAAGLATVTVAAGHPFQTGWRVTHSSIVGLTEDVNDVWMVENLTSTTYRIRGSQATGTYTASGVATYSTQEFAEMRMVVGINRSQAPGGALMEYVWRNDRFIFPGCTIDRQLEIEYQVSDSLPAVGVSLGVDGCLPFLKFRTAGLAILNLAPKTAREFNSQALGRNEDVQELGGFLGQLMKPQIRSGQRLPVVRPPFRGKRTVGPMRWMGGV
jgi:hypothetical protein